MIRIFPLYYLVVIMGLLLNQETDLGTIIHYFSFTQFILENRYLKTLGTTWSLCTEMYTYLLLPFFIFISFKVKPVIWLLGAVALYSLLQCNTGRIWNAVSGIDAFIRCLGDYFLGIWIANLKKPRSSFFLYLGIGSSIVCGIFELPLYVLFISLIAIFFGLLRNGTKTLADPFYMFLGYISYSLYIVHPMVNYLIKMPSLWGKVIVVTISSLLISVAAYFVIEQKLGNYLTSKCV